MKTNSHQDEALSDEFCRHLVRSAQADEEDIAAAANAPFLYQQLRARIAAEQELLLPFAAAKTKFSLAAWLNQWRWAWAGAAAALLLLLALIAKFNTPRVEVAEQKTLPSPVVTPTPEVAVDRISNVPAPPAVQNLPAAKRLSRPSVRRVREMQPQPVSSTETEITTDFLPLTYVANEQEQSGEVMRVEMPRSALLALGLPVSGVPSDERVKADVLVGDDGLALAIRFVRSAK